MKIKFNPFFHHHLGWLVILLFAAGGLAFGIHSLRSQDRATIILEWTTASEMDVVGYNILRGEAQEGPFIQINHQLIEPTGDPLVGGKYAFEDSSVMAGKTYYYMLEDVETTGVKNQHGPIAQEAENSARQKLFLSGFLMFSAVIFAWYQFRKTIGDKDVVGRNPIDGS